MDVYAQQERYLEIFNRGKETFEYSIDATEDWVLLSSNGGAIQDQERISITVDWTKAPFGFHEIPITISRPESATVTVNALINKPESPKKEEINGYITIQKTWKEGDVVELVLPMPVRKVVPNVNVKDIAGKVSIERGPLVYCAEQIDNPDGVKTKTLTDTEEFTTRFNSAELQGVVELKTPEDLVLIPYYAWSHRGLGEMAVWFSRE